MSRLPRRWTTWNVAPEHWTLERTLVSLARLHERIAPGRMSWGQLRRLRASGVAEVPSDRDVLHHARALGMETPAFWALALGRANDVPTARPDHQAAFARRDDIMARARRGEHMNAASLARAHGVKEDREDSIHRDLKVLRAAGVRIRYCRKLRGLRIFEDGPARRS